MGAANPTIVATITAEDKTKAAIQTATAALRELNKAMKSTGQGSFAGAANEQRRLGEAISQTNKLMNGLKTSTAAARREVSLLADAMRNVKSIGAMVIGGSVEHAGVKMVESAAHYEEQKNKVFNLSGRNPKEVASFDKITGDASAKYPIVTRNQAAHDYLELRKLSANDDGTVNEEVVRRNVMVMAKARASAAAQGIPITEQDALNLALAVEGSGRAGDPMAQQMMADAYLRAKAVLGTAIDAAKIRDYVANAKSANFPMSDPAFYYTTLARLAQGNAARLGNEASSTFNTLAGGHMTKAGAETLVRWGMIDKDQIVDGKGGKFYIKGDVKQKDLLGTDPTKWAQEVLLPGLERSGAVADDKMKARVATLRAADPTADEHVLKEKALHGLISEEIAKAGFKTTVADNLIHAIANEALIRKDVAQMKATTGIEGADTLSRNPIAAFQELSNAVENFGTVLANPIMGTVAQVLDGIAQGVSSFTTALADFQKAHPDAAKVLGAGVPAAAVVGGGALAWGALDGLLSGFGLKGSALALDKSALALEGAAVRLGAAGVAGVAAGGATAAATAAEGGILYGLGRVAGKGLKWGGRLLRGGLYAGAADVALDYADPQGNLWGLTKPVDDYVTRKTGVNPSKMDWSDFGKFWDYGNTFFPPAWGGTAPGYPALPKMEGGVPARAEPTKAEVSGTLSGAAELVQHVIVEPSPLLTTIIAAAKAVSVPMSGKLGTVMGGENGVRPGPSGVGHN